MVKVVLSATTFGGWLAGVMLLSVSGGVSAGGFYIGPKSAIGVGLANAGTVALAQDGSTLYYNPAGATQLDRAFVQVGIDALRVSTNISNQGSTAATPGTLGAPVQYGGTTGAADTRVAIPNFYAAAPVLNRDVLLGLAVTSPFGVEVDYGSGWFGRYDSVDTRLTTIDIAPTVAYRINELWSIGAGLDIQYADVKSVSAVPNTLVPGGPTSATDGSSTTTGSDWKVGFNVGVMFHAKRTRFGVAYRSPISHTLQGNTAISGLAGPLAGTNGRSATSFKLDLPQIVSVGIAHEAVTGLTLLGEIDWYGWESFKEIRLAFANGNPDIVLPQNYRNTFGFAIGAQYKWRENWTLRGGARYEQTPTVDAFRNTTGPDSDATIIGLGVSYAMSERLAIDVSYGHTFFQHADINLTRLFFAGTPAAGTVTVKGATNNANDALSVTFRYWF